MSTKYNMYTDNDVISLAYYLPQFHEIEENNRWWGKGFTEWTQLRVAQPYFANQEIRRPHAEVGEYNLLDSKVITQQWHTAKKYGIDAFLVFDYWFGNGQRLLEKPMQQVLKDDVQVEYCFCWANHSWFNKRTQQMLMRQNYLGENDYADYFQTLCPHFQRVGYVKVENKPVFAIFSPADIPDLAVFQSTFERMAISAGFDGIFWIAENTDQHSRHAHQFDRYVRTNSMFRHRKKVAFWSYLKEKLTRNYGFQNLGPFRYDYERLMNYMNVEGADEKTIPFAFAGWDTTPRHLRRGTWLSGFNSKSFGAQLTRLLPVCTRQKGPCVLLVKSWNEWAEGNVLEADRLFGFALLELYRDFVMQVKQVRMVSHD